MRKTAPHNLHRLTRLLLSITIFSAIFLTSSPSAPAYAATTFKSIAINPSQSDAGVLYTGPTFVTTVTFESDESPAVCKVSFDGGGGDETPQYNGTLTQGQPTISDPNTFSYTCVNNINSSLLSPNAAYSVKFWTYNAESVPLINGQAVQSVTVDGRAPTSTMTGELTNANGADNPDWKIEMVGTLTETGTTNYLNGRKCSFRYFANNQWNVAARVDATRAGSCSYNLDVEDAGLAAGTYALMVVSEDAFGNAESKPNSGEASVTITAEMVGVTPAPAPTPTPTPTPEAEVEADAINPADLGGVITSDGDDVDEKDVTDKGLDTEKLSTATGNEVNVRVWVVLMVVSGIGIVYSIVLMSRRGWFGFLGRLRRGRVDVRVS